MDIGAEGFQPLFMLYAKALFFIDNHHAEIIKFNRIREQRMCADDNIALPVSHGGNRLALLFGCDHARKLADINRPALKTRRECIEMLSTEQGCRSDNRNLPPAHRRHEGPAQGHFGFTKANITADKTVHWGAFFKIANYIIDCVKLIIRFGVRKTRAKFAKHTMVKLNRLGFTHRAFGGNFNELARHIAEFLMRFGFTRLPRDTA